MPETREISLGGAGTWIVLLIIALILGFFAYGLTFTASMLGALLFIIVSFSTLIGFIPVFGPILFAFWVFPAEDHWVHSFSNLPATQANWFDTDVFWIGLIITIIFTIIASILASAFLSDR